MWFSLRHDEDQGPLSTHAQKQRDKTRRDVEAAGGTYEMPPNRNVDGYHTERSSSDGKVGSIGSSSPSRSEDRFIATGRPSNGERTYTGT